MTTTDDNITSSQPNTATQTQSVKDARNSIQYFKKRVRKTTLDDYKSKRQEMEEKERKLDEEIAKFEQRIQQEKKIQLERLELQKKQEIANALKYADSPFFKKDNTITSKLSAVNREMIKKNIKDGREEYNTGMISEKNV